MEKTYGTKITSDNKVKREKYFSIREIIEPDLIRLNNGQKVKLIGIKPLSDKKNEALVFLEKKLRKSQIYLKYDDLVRNGTDVISAYVYMKNRTFINAHLIKNGFVDVDEGCEFKHLEKFRKMKENLR